MSNESEKRFLARRIYEVEESQTLAMAKATRELKSKGINVINFTLGEPDFETPSFIKEAAIEAIHSNKTFYTPVSGIPELREGIAHKLQTQNNILCKAENIVVSTGAKQSIANAMFSLVNEGDEVLILSPYWVSYVGIVQLAGGKPVLLKGSLENDYKVSAAALSSAITSRTKVLIYSSPCNPTGSVFTEAEIRAFAKVIEAHPQLFVIADEIYEYIVFEDKHFSMGSLPEIADRVITINGFSKGYAMTGWRLGYMCAPLPIAKACDKIQGQFTSATNSIGQYAALAAIKGSLDESLKMTAAYKERRALMKSLLDQIQGLKCNTPAGAFYFFPDISAFFGKKYGDKTINNADDLCLYLLYEGHVATVMGEAFGEPNCIRLSYATSQDTIREGVAKMKTALEKLK
ncbi:MAG: pyridoxal phosphate-dependent aminotransferase [Cytophagales bacterium]|nr:MAG: pyridoxal phosphate-dependent aminotransferase [Cytophagales bacterium]TAF60049.1 MAG: pyridoxal phosphate-dependent aminotransferase [Cytophagales bacterium]